jgi:hypothetical protein
MSVESIHITKTALVRPSDVSTCHFPPSIGCSAIYAILSVVKGIYHLHECRHAQHTRLLTYLPDASIGTEMSSQVPGGFRFRLSICYAGALRSGTFQIVTRVLYSKASSALESTTALA